MKIRHSTERDLERIMEIYSYARKFMADSFFITQYRNYNKLSATPV